MDKNFFYFFSRKAEQFTKEATWEIIGFEIFIILITALLLFLSYKKDKKIFLKYGIVMIGVFIFESFTHPMWINEKLGAWAYTYRDVSWILTMGWSTLILFPVIALDNKFKKLDEWKRFLINVGIVTLIALIAESLVVNFGIRNYAPESMEVIRDNFLPFINIPAAALYYIPVFISLIIAFYKYWKVKIEKRLVVPVRREKILYTFLFTLIAVILFEIMIEPMVNNMKLPRWSYFYRDVSIILSGIWIIIIGLSFYTVNKIFIYFDLYKKFIAYIILASIITIPFEALMIKNGIRVYGQSAQNNFSGINIPFTEIPIEVMFAVPFYLALIIGFIGYFQMQINDKKIFNEN